MDMKLLFASTWLHLPLLTVWGTIVDAAENGTTTAVTSNNNVTTIVALTPDQYFGGNDHDVYVTWYESLGIDYIGSNYLPASNTADPGGNGVAVHWRVDESYLYVAVAARAQDGWLALGIAEAGGMKGADIVLFESSKASTLTDMYVLDERLPLVDACQDWTLVRVQNESGFLIFEGKRLLDTADVQDHAIIDDTDTIVQAQRIIVAWGDTDIMEFHGITNRASGSIRWYNVGDEFARFQKQMESESDGYFDLKVNNFTLAAVNTAYEYFCFNWDTDVLPQGVPPDRNVAMIAFDFLPDEESRSFVHHVVVSASYQSGNASRTCLDSSEYRQILLGWTPGNLPQQLPPDVGFTAGPGDAQGMQSFRFQVHYNNPSVIEGVHDNSRLRIFYKLDTPLYEAGAVNFGDIRLRLEGTPINIGTSRFDFNCDAQCSSLVLDEPVTVISEIFHMHNRGSAAVQYQIRDGNIVHQSNVNFFDFDQTGTSKTEIIGFLFTQFVVFF
jgi:DOMON domain/Copper type II ascorbate-dependent monooxygenase, N-terminal domain